MAWLPGLVHLPSGALEAKWDEVVARLDEKNVELERRFGIGGHDRYDVDVEKETIIFSSGGQPRVVARATLVATFSHASRTLAWGGGNRNLPESVRKAAAALVDSILERDMWELSTPLFASDEPTAWALCALVCEHAGAAGVYRSPSEGGVVYLLLRDVRAV
jgi:hypothetical protein